MGWVVGEGRMGGGGRLVGVEGWAGLGWAWYWVVVGKEVYGLRDFIVVWLFQTLTMLVGLEWLNIIERAWYPSSEGGGSSCLGEA